jgi:hypothetical protein
MQDSLCITYDRDSNGTGELRAIVGANGFSGRSSAWFADSQLLAFADELHQPREQGSGAASKRTEFARCACATRKG